MLLVSMIQRWNGFGQAVFQTQQVQPHKDKYTNTTYYLDKKNTNT
jgi:hypothetical protein